MSWYASKVPFTWPGPWWISGYRPSGGDFETSQDMICAAVLADSVDHAKELIVKAHDEPVELEWRFANQRADDWAPFCERFARAAWMEWP